MFEDNLNHIFSHQTVNQREVVDTNPAVKDGVEFPNFLILLSRKWCKKTGKIDGYSVAFSRLFFCTVSSYGVMQILVSLSFSLK